MIGAGFMGRAIANQICNYVPGMRLAAIANRSIDSARRCYSEAGIADISVTSELSLLEDNIS
jgi:predicted homoserine dehydrogenase-like protein